MPTWDVQVWAELKRSDFDKRVYGFWDGCNMDNTIQSRRVLPRSGVDVRRAAPPQLQPTTKSTPNR